MADFYNTIDTWQRILDSLALGGALAKTMAISVESCQRAGPQIVPAQIVIRVLERTERYATLEWYDPTACRYGAQKWHRCLARKSGTCAVSGDKILRGEEVFKPWRTTPPPANRHAMILASRMPYPLGDGS